MTTYQKTLPRIATAPVQDINVFELAAGMPRSLRRTGQTLHVVSGVAWVTMDGADFVLSPGESLYLLPGRSHAVIEAMHHQAVTYRVERD